MSPARAALAAALLALLPVPATAQEIDRADPVATARAALVAFRTRDLEALSRLSNETNRETFAQLLEAGPGSEMYDEIFSGWQVEAVDAWDGALGNPRYDSQGHAHVPFAIDEGEWEGTPYTDILTLVMTDEGAGWGIEDINSPDLERFGDMAPTP
ncbi:hypothetical protein [Wenxinia saemankumensis]|uniref:DUF3828 domain-containing protein n=1 Tax=Wenxinia saemankumensis TaxID=1447782 RepID=A0A1M6C5D1_9RHOB|nr:hypothetical protein [Wenxinia saemankumensis]SHI56230.1 hypothetical protein SAMN05444417_1018 [Wenxinia saemankumensis]